MPPACSRAASEGRQGTKPRSEHPIYSARRRIRLGRDLTCLLGIPLNRPDVTSIAKDPYHLDMPANTRDTCKRKSPIRKTGLPLPIREFFRFGLCGARENRFRNRAPRRRPGGPRRRSAWWGTRDRCPDVSQTRRVWPPRESARFPFAAWGPLCT